MNDTAADTVTVIGGGALGAAAGWALATAIGGIGLAAIGTAIALPFIAIGTGLGLAFGGLFVLGKRIGRSEAADGHHG